MAVVLPEPFEEDTVHRQATIAHELFARLCVPETLPARLHAWDDVWTRLLAEDEVAEQPKDDRLQAPRL